jgi:CTP:phosphocholine cytidylyltransferase-like protein/thiamine kinase-like enzyme
MSLSRNEFAVLDALATAAKSTVGEGGVGSAESMTQRTLAQTVSLSLGTVNAAHKSLTSKGLIEGFTLTPQGLAALQPYQVDNAVIMAAGMSSRFVPLSYELPKGLLEVRGERLIEREIRQLQAAGITDITLVVGYMKEAFFYLEDKFGVTIRINEEYTSRNNNSSLWVARDKLRNTYVCSSDNYFATNVFEPYVYQAYYSGVYVAGASDEYCITTGPGGRITKVRVGGHDSYVMLGHVYFDVVFSAEFVRILEAEYALPETAPKLWEDIYLGHLKELDMVLRPYDADVVYEFDSLADLTAFDTDFLTNVDSKILDNICATLGCTRDAVVGIEPIKAGITNLSFRFVVGDGEYVYRHPGAGTDEIINRASEAYSQGIARELGLDSTFIYQQPQEGWKISHYIPDCVPFDYHNADHVRQGLAIARKLHTSGKASQWDFDVYAKADEIVRLLEGLQYPKFSDYEEIVERAARVASFAAADNIPKVLCHNDFYDPNFLVRDDLMYLIDWEYSAMGDYASDLGTFICCSDYTLDEAKDVISQYFEGDATPAQMRHCIAYVGLSGYYWFVWALYKEALGDPVGEWLHMWYRAAKTYGKLAIELYEN